MAQGQYVRTFPTIELQTTFYQPPERAVASRWRALAPNSFEFCVKAWQLITHTPASPTYRRLRSPVSPEEHELYGSFRPTEQVALAWERTREVAALLDAKVIVFQCPKSFLPTGENMRNLERFFGTVERDGRRFAWEPRGEAWRPDIVREICLENDLAHCVDPFEAAPALPGPVYWRLHGREGYRYRYTDEDLRDVEAMLREHSDSAGPNYIMFNNIYSRDDAQRFLARIMHA